VTGLFITGTDTEVGKTTITAAIAAALKANGRRPLAVKPVATGAKPPGEDALQIAAAAGHEPLVHTCFPVPASPERAAIEAGAAVDFASLFSWIQVQAEGADPLLVEGVGGWAVPLCPDQRMSDLAEALGLPVLIVAANRLGVLNHTLLTVEAVHARDLSVAGVVLNNHFASDVSLAAWNEQDLRRHLGDGIPMCAVGTVFDPATAGQAVLRLL
jgi:dethiobiotin synthetase